MKTSELLLGPDVRSLEAADYKDYVRSLYMKPVSKTDTAVDGVSITWGKRKIIRIKRDPKYVTFAELETLAKEFATPIDELYRLFRKRKIPIRRKA